jgi:hypothetical protein
MEDINASLTNGWQQTGARYPEGKRPHFAAGYITCLDSAPSPTDTMVVNDLWDKIWYKSDSSPHNRAR